jgi:hypothetical protein
MDIPPGNLYLACFPLSLFTKKTLMLVARLDYRTGFFAFSSFCVFGIVIFGSSPSYCFESFVFLIPHVKGWLGPKVLESLERARERAVQFVVRSLWLQDHKL